MHVAARLPIPYSSHLCRLQYDGHRVIRRNIAVRVAGRTMTGAGVQTAHRPVLYFSVDS